VDNTAEHLSKQLSTIDISRFLLPYVVYYGFSSELKNSFFDDHTIIPSKNMFNYYRPISVINVGFFFPLSISLVHHLFGIWPQRERETGKEGLKGLWVEEDLVTVGKNLLD
jgi:hypothetical protein